ncbi:MAG: SMC family ATPase [Lachnospiraceae bacterium]|nr:SMC family ATPase [Lachnospiraceae bacterium]
MRPLSLKISAFGPYAGSVTIPMEKLGDRGLYLITGDTGAGKTTIFDAICFVLFGEASGNNRSVSMLRSKYAADDTETMVEMTFVHRKTEYVVRRNPEYMRASKRGSGLAKQVQNAEFYTADGSVIATGYTEVSKAVTELLGMNRSQFMQISMLAQGDFLKLLLADTKTRQDIFRNLFKTSYYQMLQNDLEAERKSISERADDIKKSIDQYIAGIVCIQDEELSETVQKARNGELTLEAVIELTEELSEKYRCKKESLTEENGDLDKEIEQLNKLIGKAENIKKIREALDETEENLKKTETELKETLETLNEKKESLKDKEKLSKQIAFTESKLEDYDELVSLDTQIRKLTEEDELEKAEAEKLSADSEKKEAEIFSLKEEEEKLKKLKTDKDTSVLKKDKTDGEIKDIDDLIERIDKIKEKEEELKGILKDYENEEADFKSLNDRYEELDEKYRNGQAGILAQTLKDGECCPVCGSKTHPKPAVCSEELPTDAELKKAKDSSEKARKRVHETSEHISELRSALTLMISDKDKLYNRLVKENPKYGTVISDKDEIENAEAVRELLKKESDDLNALIREAEKNSEREEELGRIIPEAEEVLEDNKKKLTDIKERSAVRASRLSESIKSREKLIAGLEYESRKEALDKINEFKEKCESLEKDHNGALEAYNKKLEALNGLKGQAEGYKNSLKDASQTDPDMEKQKREELTKRRETVLKSLQELSSATDANDRIKENLKQKIEELSETNSLLIKITALSDTANGKLKGKEKIMLETYVQMTYFDRIISRANIRLLKMSGAQYELKRIEEAESIRGQRGLELGVIDHYNGSERSVKTLSGGESFMAALSLALGLSEEIQSSAGGIQVDTLFVDEGFGSLDSDALELAYNALCSLTDGNRLVGIISHVSELKEKIDDQIIVKKNKMGGSTAVLHV